MKALLTTCNYTYLNLYLVIKCLFDQIGNNNHLIGITIMLIWAIIGTLLTIISFFNIFFVTLPRI